MADLIAQGETPEDRWRRPLPPGRPIVVGRTNGAWSVPWDDRVSRLHVRLEWNGERLSIEHLPDARNPVFVRGEAIRASTIFPGQHFVVGKTAFTLVEDRVAVASDLPEPLREQAFSSQYLRRLRFRHPDLRIENLSRLPELITSATNDRELCQRLSNVLLTGVPAADAVAIVDTPQPTAAAGAAKASETAEAGDVRVRHWDRRTMTMGEFRPSERLIRATLERNETLLHVSRTAETPGYTVSDNYDWACCLPVPGAACRGWAIYLAGRLNSSVASNAAPSDAADFGDDMKFTEIVAATLGSLRDLGSLTRRQASLAPFFSPRSARAVGRRRSRAVPRSARDRRDRDVLRLAGLLAA
ncbi:MAG: FHA domain-containing protein [Pirellulales bacterium]